MMRSAVFGVALRKSVDLALALGLMLACACRPAKPSSIQGSAGDFAAIEASADLDGAAIGASDAPATLVLVFASWCVHCHHELEELAAVRRSQPAIRVLGVSYRDHEEYDGRGNAQALRAYVAAHASWLRVVPADEHLFELLGRPAKVPTLFVYDRTGRRVATFDRRDRTMPDSQELLALLGRTVR